MDGEFKIADRTIEACWGGGNRANYVEALPSDFDTSTKYLEIRKKHKKYVFSMIPSLRQSGTLGIHQYQLQHTILSFGDVVRVRPCTIKTGLINVVIEVVESLIFAARTHDIREVEREFKLHYRDFALSVGQIILFSYGNGEAYHLFLVVKDLEGLDSGSDGLAKVQFGIFKPETNIIFLPKPNYAISLINCDAQFPENAVIVENESTKETGAHKNLGLHRRTVRNEHY